MKGEWTHAVCDVDWLKREGPLREPHRMVEEYREWETCCYCGELTHSGIYVRANSDSVPHPARRPV